MLLLTTFSESLKIYDKLHTITIFFSPDTKLAIFDHISSNYGIILPVEVIGIVKK